MNESIFPTEVEVDEWRKSGWIGQRVFLTGLSQSGSPPDLDKPHPMSPGTYVANWDDL